MRKDLKLFLLLITICLLPNIIHAQLGPHDLLIPYTGDPTVTGYYIDDIITADNPNNVPTDAQRVYVLQR
jgi:hypothetical protein